MLSKSLCLLHLFIPFIECLVGGLLGDWWSRRSLICFSLPQLFDLLNGVTNLSFDVGLVTSVHKGAVSLAFFGLRNQKLTPRRLDMAGVENIRDLILKHKLTSLRLDLTLVLLIRDLILDLLLLLLFTHFLETDDCSLDLRASGRPEGRP